MYHSIGNGLYIKTPKQCSGCPCFHFDGLSNGYFLDARCKLIEPTQDWYYKDFPDKRGGWVGDDLDEIEGYNHGYYYYHHVVKEGTRAKQCPCVKRKDGESECNT